jgi:hypothetical protein
LRKGRAAEQKKRREARVLKLAADATAQGILDEYQKIRTKNIQAANEAVGILITGGLGEHMKKKKGKKREKKIKEFLDENLRAPPADDVDSGGEAEHADAADDNEMDEDTTSQEQIAKLRFEDGRSDSGPPDGVKNKFYPGLAYEYEYNYFQGIKADDTIFDMQLNPAWCENVFELFLTQLCRLYPGNWFHVPIGSAHGIPEAIASPPFNPVVVRYQQKDRAYYLSYSVASCLNYMGHLDEASKVAAAAPDLVSLPGDMAFEKLRAILMIEVLPHMGLCMVWNGKKRQRYKSRKVMSVGEIVSSKTPYLTLVQPKGTDGSVDHAVCVVDDIIFDSTLTYALKLRKESFDVVCGPSGMAELGRAIRFCLPYGVKHTKPEREKRGMKRNWD